MFHPEILLGTQITRRHWSGEAIRHPWQVASCSCSPKEIRGGQEPRVSPQVPKMMRITNPWQFKVGRAGCRLIQGIAQTGPIPLARSV